MILTCQQEMGGRLMVYKVLGCRDFITLLLFLHHRWSSQTERFCTCCGSCVWHSFIAAHTQLEGDSSIHRLRYYSPPKSQSMAMDTKYVLSHWTVLLCGWGSWYFSVSSHTPLFPAPILRAHFLPYLYTINLQLIFSFCVCACAGALFSLYYNM